MDFYKMKRYCFEEIDEWIKSDEVNKSLDKLYYKISTKYGFGKDIIDERLKLLSNLGIKLKEESKDNEQNKN